jgi:hypothetical protein
MASSVGLGNFVPPTLIALQEPAGLSVELPGMIFAD